MKRLFLAGPDPDIMRGRRPAFERDRQLLADAGYRPVVPRDVATGVNGWQPVMRRLLRSMLLCGGVALASGWDADPGARLAETVASSLGIPCRTVDAWLWQARSGAEARRRADELGAGRPSPLPSEPARRGTSS